MKRQTVGARTFLQKAMEGRDLRAGGCARHPLYSLLAKRGRLYPLLLLPCLCTLLACSAVNCPLETSVLCNYHFYNLEGQAYKLGQTLTISTLLPGTKTQYIYQKLGEASITSDAPNATLVAEGYVETVAEVRRDTVLINRLWNATSVSLPMSYFASCDTLVFSYSDLSAKDTLYVEHDNYTYVDLPECGSSRFARLKQIRSTDIAISRLEIVRADVNYDGLENVIIYFNAQSE